MVAPSPRTRPFSGFLAFFSIDPTRSLSDRRPGPQRSSSLGIPQPVISEHALARTWSPFPGVVARSSSLDAVQPFSTFNYVHSSRPG